MIKVILIVFSLWMLWIVLGIVWGVIHGDISVIWNIFFSE